jgi:Glycosyl transferase family 11
VTPRFLEIPVSPGGLGHERVPSRIAVSVASRLRVLPRSWVVQRSFDEDALSRVNDRTRLVFGYFQNAEYVQEAWPRLAQYLGTDSQTQPMTDPPHKAGVAVHVRLGDYISNPMAARAHGVPDPGYYVRSIRRLIVEGIPPVVHLVSDEPQEALRRLKDAGLPPGADVYLTSADSPWKDLAVLAGADAVVMSNSSFSWWGAYLAHRSRKASVIFPPRWFSDPELPTPPLFVQGWVRGE